MTDVKVLLEQVISDEQGKPVDRMIATDMLKEITDREYLITDSERLTEFLERNRHLLGDRIQFPNVQQDRARLAFATVKAERFCTTIQNRKVTT